MTMQAHLAKFVQQRFPNVDLVEDCLELTAEDCEDTLESALGDPLEDPVDNGVEVHLEDRCLHFLFYGDRLVDVCEV